MNIEKITNDYNKILSEQTIEQNKIYKEIDARFCCLIGLLDKRYHSRWIKIFSCIAIASIFIISILGFSLNSIYKSIKENQSLSEQKGMLKSEIELLLQRKAELESITPQDIVPILEQSGITYIPLPNGYIFKRNSSTKDNSRRRSP